MKKTDVVTRRVMLSGFADLMFDRYAGDNKTELDVSQKMYFLEDGMTLCLPAANIMSLLTSQNTESAPKRFLDSREYKKVAAAFLSYISVSPFMIPITRNNKAIVFNGFSGDQDEQAGVYIHRSVARLAKGIPNPKIRPVVRAPWEIEFDLSIFPNNDFGEEMLQGLFKKAGIAIGIGTFRGVYGKFQVSKWE